MTEKGRSFEAFKSESRPGGVALSKFDAEEQHDAIKTIVVIGSHRYYNLLSVQLVRASLTVTRQIKNPLTVISPLDHVWQSAKPEVLRFYASVARFQAFYEPSIADLEAVRAVVQNPAGYAFYVHDAAVSEKISAKSISPIKLKEAELKVAVRITLENDLYIIRPEVVIKGAYIPVGRVSVKFDWFAVIDQEWWLGKHPDALKVLVYFRKYNDELRLPHADFVKFHREVLAEMENHVAVAHDYLEPPATPPASDSGQAIKKIYLSDFGDYITIDPVVAYAQAEVPVLSNRHIFVEGLEGTPVRLQRNNELEEAFIAGLIRQHPHFEEQADNPLQYFYLHKARFVHDGWFLRAFEQWREQGIEVMGVNEIKGVDINPEKASVSVQVVSGINWFNARVEVKFGRKKASLNKIHKAVKNKNRYVTLDDGTLGLLPEEWLRRFEDYFAAGSIVGDVVQVPKSNFEAVAQHFKPDELDEQVASEISLYRRALSMPSSIVPVAPSAELKGTLRPYQLMGLSWLNFLDDHGFGGCLADDMGLGKTIQVIAFLLRLKEKNGQATHLLVAPTSVLHNWRNELAKFAPSLKVAVFHGPRRLRALAAAKEHDVLLTTYNTMLSDMAYLRKHAFDYVILDESQNIKNLGSQRNKAARMLKARNRLILTGTPLENNSFDLYAQLSFACPGLLGSRTYFRNTYAMAIDKFQHKHSSAALKQKVSPFILRRTKAEVASELPEKTEMVLHCEMEPEQRKIYEAHEKELRDLVESTQADVILKKPMYVLRGITQLRQICNSPLLLGHEKQAGDRSSKIDTLADQLRNITGDHKVLVFSQFVSMLQLIGQALDHEKIGFCTLTGSTTSREEVVRQFEEDDTTRVFLISLKAGGTGLNLTRASYVYLVDPWWNPAVENQAIDRCYRIGQDKKVVAVRLICPETIEEKIQLMQQKKAKLSGELVPEGNSIFRSMSKADWLELLG